MRTVTRLGALLVLGVLGGCATRADVIEQDRRLGQQVADQRRQIQSIQREVEHLRGDLEGAPRRGGGALDDRLQQIEERLARLEGKAPPPAPPSDVDTTTNAAPVPIAPTPPPPVASAPPPPPAPPPVEDAWAREVSRDQQAISASNAAERADLVPIMDTLARKDCTRAVPQLNGFAAQKKDSPLASNALYWAARCYALKGDRNQAISKFYDVVTKYPKGSKAPAALWEQGNLFIEMGDTPDARLALGKLIKDYPNSDEAARARKRLTELDR